MKEPGTLVAVENGTEEAVVLDCPFTLEKGDRFEDLVIKWYYKEEPLPIYQWIPASMPPQVGWFWLWVVIVLVVDVWV